MIHRQLYFLMLCFLPILMQAQSNSLFSQEEDSLTVADPDIGQEEDSITTPSDLIIAYEESAQTIREIRNDLLAGFEVDGIESEYNSLHDQLIQYYEIDSSQISRATLSAVNDLIIIFERRNDALKGWQETLTGYTTALSDYRINLTKIKDRLSVNYDILGEEGKKFYDRRYRSLVSETDSLNTVINRKLDRILEIEYEVAQDYAFTTRRIEALRNYLREYWREVRKPEPDTWNFISMDVERESGRLRTTAWRITSFFIDNAGRSVILVLLMIGVYLGIRRIGRIKEKEAEETKEEDNNQFDKNPVALALLFGGVLFPVVYPPTTTLMYDFLLLISYIPFLVVLRRSLDQSAYKKYFVFYVVFIILKLQNLFLPVSGFSSIVLIGCALIFAYTILLAPFRHYFTVRWRWIRVFNYLIGITLIFGIVLMIFKRHTLAKIMINGAGETMAIAYILVYLAVWFDQFIEFLRQRPRFSSLSVNRDKLESFWHKWHNRIYFLLLFLFVISMLRNFNVLNNVQIWLTDLLTSERVLGDLTFTIGGIVLFVLMIYLSTKISSSIKFFTEDKSYFHSQKRTANLSVMLRFFIITIGFLLALVVSGIPLDKITIILGALSVGIGFGLQNIVNNLISGLILIFERPIQSGDIVEVQQFMGVVKDIGIRSSVIRTYDGSEVILPNGDLISQAVINWTLSNKHRRVEVLIGVAYGSDAQKTTEVLSRVVEDHDKILRLPKPLILFNGFGDSSLDFRMLFWTSDIDNWLATRSEIMTAVYDALAKAEIEIPFPQRDIHVRSWAPEAAPRQSENGAAPKNEKPEEKGKPEEKDKPPTKDKSDEKKRSSQKSRHSKPNDAGSPKSGSD